MAVRRGTGANQGWSLLLGRTIARARQAAGLTQQQLCRRAGLSYSTLTKIERGVIQTPSVFTIARIAQVTNTSIEGLLAPLSQAQAATTGVEMVYFAVDGVLVDGLDSLWLQLASDQGKPVASIKRRFWRHWPAVQRSRDSDNRYRLPSQSQIGWESEYARAAQPIKPMTDLLVRLNQKFRVGLLTNTPQPLIQKLTQAGKLPELDYQSIVSADKVGATKPTTAIYDHGRQVADLEPDQILLVDRSPASLAQAESLGWKIHKALTHRPVWTANRIASYLRV